MTESSKMSTIIVGDGLTRAVLSPELPYRDSRENVGQAESARLLGRGKHFGQGPLPTFLARAAQAASDRPDLRVVFLHGAPSGAKDPALELVGSLCEVGHLAEIVLSEPDSIPWQRLNDALGLAPGAPEGEAPTHRILVVGCHTEGRIMSLSTFFRNAVPNGEVAVASHLVGSATPDAHFAALRHNFPMLGVSVLLDLTEAAGFVGLEKSAFVDLGCRPCAIELPDDHPGLEPVPRRIVELLCLNWTRTKLRPLGGGFSGSLLLLADGFKDSARTEPMVLKIDAFAQMRRELDGYHLVKDFFGKHVPTFSYPVTGGDMIGVGMELAAMEGRPLTLQESFEQADDESGVDRFTLRLAKALELLSEKLYRNTLERETVVPFRAFGLHAKKQLDWLRKNAETTLGYLEKELADQPQPKPKQLQKLLRIITTNEDGIESERCLSHGDLNFANVICDQGDNIWFIDWTHSATALVELDFAKLENDVKFVMSKDFDPEDLARFRLFEEYLLENRLPARANALPETLKFAKWDLRFRKILETVRAIRNACFALKFGDDWLVYRIALLRYALHTLSFDKRRGRGECEPTQLMAALYSVEGLAFNLVADDYHLKIRSERPSEYPPRLRVSIDEAPWMMECPHYDPPYYVSRSVLASDRSRGKDGWADPEDIAQVIGEPRITEVKQRDDEGRPLNPHGRTGIAGRGLLGLWGVNRSVTAMVLRKNTNSGELDLLLGNSENSSELDLPKGFVLPGEDSTAALGRVLEHETGWRPTEISGEVIEDDYTYDPRQTDHAWVETEVIVMLVGQDVRRSSFQPGGEFDEVMWWPLEAPTINRVPSAQARLLRHGITRLVELGRMDRAAGEQLLATTG